MSAVYSDIGVGLLRAENEIDILPALKRPGFLLRHA